MVDEMNYNRNKNQKPKKTGFVLDTGKQIVNEMAGVEVLLNQCDLKADYDELDLNSFGKRKRKSHLLSRLIDNSKPEGKNAKDDAIYHINLEDSDRDYTYEELIHMAFSVIRDKNPVLDKENQKFIMRPPQIIRIGTKKTFFANFSEVCQALYRQPRHLLDFILAELGTSGSINGNFQLIIKGRFQQKQIENVLRRYIKEYVLCRTCRSPDTILQKDVRMFFLQCDACGSRCSVASIKCGFQAVTSKRSVIRDKTTS